MTQAQRNFIKYVGHDYSFIKILEPVYDFCTNTHDPSAENKRFSRSIGIHLIHQHLILRVQNDKIISKPLLLLIVFGLLQLDAKISSSFFFITRLLPHNLLRKGGSKKVRCQKEVECNYVVTPQCKKQLNPLRKQSELEGVTCKFYQFPFTNVLTVLVTGFTQP